MIKVYIKNVNRIVGNNIINSQVNQPSFRLILKLKKRILLNILDYKTYYFKHVMQNKKKKYERLNSF